MGFERAVQVEGPGQFSVRGGILDIYNLADDCPYRIEFWDDEIDTIRSFDAESQRSIERHEEISIYPAAEMVFTGYKREWQRSRKMWIRVSGFFRKKEGMRQRAI